MLDIKPDAMAPSRPTPFHLRDLVDKEGAGEVAGLQRKKKKKKKKKKPAAVVTGAVDAVTPSAWNATTNYDEKKAQEKGSSNGANGSNQPDG